METLEKLFLVACATILTLSIVGIVLLTVAPATYSWPQSATGNPIGSKTGIAEDSSYFFIFGDASDANLLQACRNGGITKISTVDYKMENFLFVKQTFTCTVNGE